jgi:two-component system chemotaxis response regulator CheY
MLRQIGFRTVEENDGTSVLQALKNSRYDLVICDWQMTPTPGIEVLEFVRADADLKALRFIMLTGENTSDAVLKAVDMGTDDYIAKPFSVQTLKDKILRVLSSS